MTKETKVALLFAAVLVAELLGSLVLAFQGMLARQTASLFATTECETGRIPVDFGELVRQTRPDLAFFARSLWSDYGIEARLVSGPDGRRIDVSGTYFWPFRVVQPISDHCEHP